MNLYSETMEKIKHGQNVFGRYEGNPSVCPLNMMNFNLTNSSLYKILLTKDNEIIHNINIKC